MIKKILVTLAFGLLLAFIPNNQQDKEVVIKLPVSKVSIVLKGLGKLPLEEAQETYLTILTQAQLQLQDTVKKK
jgi:hypothetical protein